MRRIQIFLLFVIFLLTSSVFATGINQKRPYSLTISGGISLGVYEAGLNWVIIEMLRNGRLKGDKNARLLSITGASAGAINTLIAALRYCEKPGIDSSVDNNLFNTTWRTMGIEDLLPENENEYDHLAGHPDGLLSRKSFAEILQALSEKARARNYRENCQVNLGLTVTRLVPEDKVIMLGDDKQEIKVQRFVIPLTLVSKNGYVVFRNNLNYAKRNRELGYLLLRQDPSGYVPFENIIKSALASSAFPVAFGRIRLPYCRKKDVGEDSRMEATLDASENHLVCPPGYMEYVYDFIDGGFFDNVPLGLAVELSECRKGINQDCIREATSESEILTNEVVNYIYMEPSKRRKAFITDNEQEDQLSDGFGLYNQGKFWIKAQEIYANAELYRALREKFDRRDEENKLRRLLLTSRYPPLGGAYLAHFGAFFGQVFRDFDYYVGIYDGIINFAEHCINDAKKYPIKQKALIKSQCISLGMESLKDPENPHYSKERKIGLFIEKVVNDLLSEEDYVAKQMIRILAESEFMTYRSENVRYAEWQWLDSLPGYKAVKNKQGSKNSFYYELFLLLDSDQDLDFSKIISGLKKVKKAYPDYFKTIPGRGSNQKLSDMIDKPESWKFAFGRKVFSRLYTLEKKDEDNHMALIPIRLGSMALNSLDSSHNNNIWSISSIEPKGWQHLIPDEVALDGSQTGLVFTYRKALYRYQKSSTYLEGEFSPLHWVRKREDRTFFASAGLNLRYARRSPAFSSFGGGIRLYKNYDDKAGLQNNAIVGVAFDIGLFADKYRITIEHKFIDPQYQDERWLLKFGLNDFKGISDVLFGD